MSTTNAIADLTKPTTTGAAPAATGTGVQALTTPNTANTAAGTASTGLAQGSAWKAAVPKQVNDSVADKVKELTSQDSALMQQAKTEGLKIANRRGLLNSSMAVGASQDAMVSKALPIASQDASQSFQKNMAARDFEFSMEGQDDAQQFQGGQAALDRDLQKILQSADITSREGLAKAQRELDVFMQGKSIDATDRQQIRDISSREGLAAAERALQELMQGKDISSREKLAAAERDLQANMQARDLDIRERMAWQERVQQSQMQEREIAYQQSERNLDRGLQEKLASWNLKSADRNAAAQLLTNMETMYADAYSSIMANQNLDAATRTAQVNSAKALRDKQLNFVEQMYVIDLNW